MKRDVIFKGSSFTDFNEWQVKDAKIYRKIAELIEEARRNPFAGKGKPEPLKHSFSGCWSRRINDEHRLVYSVNETEVQIADLSTAREALKNDKSKQAKIISDRTKTVQDNLGMLNDLHDVLTEILTVGKILYKATDPAKLKDYTFENLKNRVRRATKPEKKRTRILRQRMKNKI